MELLVRIVMRAKYQQLTTQHLVLNALMVKQQQQEHQFAKIALREEKVMLQMVRVIHVLQGSQLVQLVH